uniref:PAP-associated domain-containing protein n=1 Tax=Panagrolaimus sp. PS1159 TaxID=55785 RepID=A0AC35G130_9BILA
MTLKPVPPLNLKNMIEEGYHPTAYVLPVSDSVVAMKRFKKLREENQHEFEAFDAAIYAFAKEKENSQSTKTLKAKHKIHKMIAEALPKVPGSTLHFCGSSINACGTDSCDVDLCWAIPVKPEIESDVPFPMVEQGSFSPDLLLRHAMMKIEELDGIVSLPEFVPARVRIIKFEIEMDGIIFPCDVNINNIAGLYTMVLMVLHFLQCGVSPPILPNLNALCPDLFDGNLDLHEIGKYYDLDLNIKMDRNETPIGDLLIGFFRYYAMFNYQHEGIVLRMGCVSLKSNLKDFFFLEEVYDRITVPKNLNSARMDYIKCTFLDAFLGLQRGPDFKKLMNDERVFMKKKFIFDDC